MLLNMLTFVVCMTGPGGRQCPASVPIPPDAICTVACVCEQNQRVTVFLEKNPPAPKCVPADGLPNLDLCIQDGNCLTAADFDGDLDVDLRDWHKVLERINIGAPLPPMAVIAEIAP